MGELGSTSSEFFKKILDTKNVGMIKNMVVYKHNENMLLTSHVKYLQSNSNHMAIQTENAYIFLTNVRCGYNGSGPRETLKIIQHAFPEWYEKQEAKIEFAVFRYEGIRIENDGVYIRLTEEDIAFSYKSTVFDTDFMNLDSPNFDVDLGNRTIRIFNPQRTNFLGTIRLIQKMRLKRLSYYIGKDSPLDSKYRFSALEDVGAWGNEEQYYSEGVTGVNIALEGERFTVYILVKEEEAKQVLNTLYLHIFHRPLFQINSHGEMYRQAKIKKIFLNKFLKKTETIIQGSKEFTASEVYGNHLENKLGIYYGMEIDKYDKK
ncbi:hypothetical protein [Listeria seeligeri]|nr:hypothetical protein [Listeria seeligeri]MBC1990404.1 hypothetical protein [Listeria seeligeri]